MQLNLQREVDIWTGIVKLIRYKSRENRECIKVTIYLIIDTNNYIIIGNIIEIKETYKSQTFVDILLNVSYRVYWKSNNYLHNNPEKKRKSFFLNI